jgi:hypothetical protein
VLLVEAGADVLLVDDDALPELGTVEVCGDAVVVLHHEKYKPHGLFWQSQSRTLTFDTI